MTTTPHQFHEIGRPECVAADCEPDLPRYADPNPEGVDVPRKPAAYIARRKA